MLPSGGTKGRAQSRELGQVDIGLARGQLPAATHGNRWYDHSLRWLDLLGIVIRGFASLWQCQPMVSKVYQIACNKPLALPLSNSNSLYFLVLQFATHFSLLLISQIAPCFHCLGLCCTMIQSKLISNTWDLPSPVRAFYTLLRSFRLSPANILKHLIKCYETVLDSSLHR